MLPGFMTPLTFLIKPSARSALVAQSRKKDLRTDVLDLHRVREEFLAVLFRARQTLPNPTLANVNAK